MELKTVLNPTHKKPIAQVIFKDDFIAESRPTQCRSKTRYYFHFPTKTISRESINLPRLRGRYLCRD